MSTARTLAAAALVAVSATASLAGGPVIAPREPDPVVIVPAPASSLNAGLVVLLLAAAAALVLSDSSSGTRGPVPTSN
jgi:hypothetical protein